MEAAGFNIEGDQHTPTSLFSICSACQCGLAGPQAALPPRTQQLHHSLVAFLGRNGQSTLARFLSAPASSKNGTTHVTQGLPCKAPLKRDVPPLENAAFLSAMHNRQPATVSCNKQLTCATCCCCTHVSSSLKQQLHNVQVPLLQCNAANPSGVVSKNFQVALESCNYQSCASIWSCRSSAPASSSNLTTSK